MKNILIVKLGALGDICMASAMLPLLRERYPEAAITWLAGKEGSNLLQLIDNQLEVCTINDNLLLTGNVWQKAQLVLQANLKLLRRSFDLTLVPYQHSLYRLLCLAAHTKKLHSFREPSYLQQGAWHPAEYARLALDRYVPAHQITFPKAVCPPAPAGNIQATDVLLVPGGAKNLLADDAQRRWPVQYYVSTAKELLIAGFTVGIVGSSTDSWVLEEFSDLPVRNFIGKTNLSALFWLLHNARLLITHDTGIMHFMTLIGGNMIALFGATSPTERLIARHGLAILTAENDIPCSPCYNGKSFKDCTDIQCMRAIFPERVLAKAFHLLHNKTGEM